MGPSFTNPKHPNLIIRLATLSDIPSLTTLITTSVLTLHTPFYTPTVISLALKHVYGVDTTLITDNTYYLITTTTSATPVACGGWSFRRTLYGGDQFISRDDEMLDPGKDAAKIRAMFVLPSYGGMGLGKWLIGFLEERVRERGFRRVEMGATLAGVGFYGRMGYRELEEGREESVLEGGESMMVVRMEKELM